MANNGKLRSILLALIFITVNASPVFAMRFETVLLNDGTKAVLAYGRIDDDPSLLDRFRNVAKDVTSAASARGVLLLDSLGGDVAPAYELADEIDRLGFDTVVAWDAVCASACASIVFLAGNSRMLVGNGQLIFHPCETNSPADKAVSLCNRDIAEFMRRHGIDFDMLYYGLSYLTHTGIFPTVTASTNCVGFLVPFELTEVVERERAECIRLLSIIREQRFQDLDEQMSPETHIGSYVATWTPPEQWRVGTFQGAFSIGYRREGHSPAGPEIEFFCDVRAPHLVFLRVRNWRSNGRGDFNSIEISSSSGRIGGSITARNYSQMWKGASGSEVVFSYAPFERSELLRVLRASDTLFEFLGSDTTWRISVSDAVTNAQWGSLLKNCNGRFPGAR